MPVHQIPEYKWKDAGTAIVNVIQVPKEDHIVSVIPVSNFEEEGKSLVFVSRKGQVKRTELKEYVTSGLAPLRQPRSLRKTALSRSSSDNNKDIVLISKEGMSIRFNEQEVNAMGRVSGGVRGIQLRDGDEVVAALWVENDEGEILTITDLGYGKRLCRWITRRKAAAEKAWLRLSLRKASG